MNNKLNHIYRISLANYDCFDFVCTEKESSSDLMKRLSSVYGERVVCCSYKGLTREAPTPCADEVEFI